MLQLLLLLNAVHGLGRGVLCRLMPGFHHSVAVLRLPFSRCRFRTPLPLPYALARRRRWLAGQLRNGTTEK